MAEPETIYFSEDKILITTKWAIFDKQKYSMSAIEGALLEERYQYLSIGGFIAIFGLILLIVAPALLKIAGFILLAIGVERLRRRSFVVVLALLPVVEADGPPLPVDRYFFEDVFTSPDRKMAQGIVDAIKVVKIHERQNNSQTTSPSE